MTTPIHVDLVNVSSMPVNVPGHNATVTVRSVYDPTYEACGLGVGGCKVLLPIDPFNPGWFVSPGASSELVIEARITDADGDTVAVGGFTILYAGQVVSTFPYVFP